MKPTRKQMIDFLSTPNKAFKVFCEPSEFKRLMKEAKAGREAKSDEELLKAYREAKSDEELLKAYNELMSIGAYEYCKNYLTLNQL